MTVTYDQRPTTTSADAYAHDDKFPISVGDVTDPTHTLSAIAHAGRTLWHDTRAETIARSTAETMDLPWRIRSSAWLNANVAAAVTVTDALNTALAEHPDPAYTAVPREQRAGNAAIGPDSFYTYTFGPSHAFNDTTRYPGLDDITATIRASDVCDVADRLYHLTHWTAASIETAASLARQQLPAGRTSITAAVHGRKRISDAITTLANIDTAIIDSGLAATYIKQQEARSRNGPSVPELLTAITSIWDPR